MKRETKADVRRRALTDALAEVRADILLEPDMTPAQMLDRVTKSLERLIAKEN